MNNLNFLSVGDVGAFIADIPDDLMLSLNRQIKQIQNNFTDSKSYTDSLVGHIKHEYELEKTKELDNFINECVVEYNKKWPEYLDDVNVLSFDAPVELYNSWVNIIVAADL
jgi:predicted transcriptional regulator